MHARMWSRPVVFLVCCALFSCEPVPAADAGFPVADAGDASTDAGPPDAGTADGGSDAGPSDAGADAGTDAGAASSRGSGKLTCQRTGTVNTTAGVKSYCVATAGGAEFKLIEPDDVATNPAPLQLAVYLHGDGARAYTGDTALRLQAPWTTSHHVLYVAARALDGCAWWVAPGVDACDAGVVGDGRDLAGVNAQALEAIVTAVRAGWDVADAPMLFGGSSGGSIFLSGSYFPRYGGARQGTWALNCGGDAPWTPLSWDAGEPGPHRFFFTWGDQDFLKPDILAAEDWFGAAGFPVNEKIIAGAGHCGFDHLGRTTEIWGTP